MLYSVGATSLRYNESGLVFTHPIEGGCCLAVGLGVSGSGDQTSMCVPGPILGGSDQRLNGHRFDSTPLATGCITQGMSCQIVLYNHEEHSELLKILTIIISTL